MSDYDIFCAMHNGCDEPDSKLKMSTFHDDPGTQECVEILARWTLGKPLN